MTNGIEQLTLEEMVRFGNKIEKWKRNVGFQKENPEYIGSIDDKTVEIGHYNARNIGIVYIQVFKEKVNLGGKQVGLYKPGSVEEKLSNLFDKIRNYIQKEDEKIRELKLKPLKEKTQQGIKEIRELLSR